MYLGVGSKQGWNVLLSTCPGLIKEGEPTIAFSQKHSKESHGVREDREGRDGPGREREIIQRGRI